MSKTCTICYVAWIRKIQCTPRRKLTVTISTSRESYSCTLLLGALGVWALFGNISVCKWYEFDSDLPWPYCKPRRPVVSDHTRQYVSIAADLELNASWIRLSTYVRTYACIGQTVWTKDSSMTCVSEFQTINSQQTSWNNGNRRSVQWQSLLIVCKEAGWAKTMSIQTANLYRTCNFLLLIPSDD